MMTDINFNMQNLIIVSLIQLFTTQIRNSVYFIIIQQLLNTQSTTIFIFKLLLKM